MHPLRDWLFKTVADELIFNGVKGLNLNHLAAAGGLSPQEVHALFPDKRFLVQALIEEISLAQQEYILQHSQDAAEPTERLAQFITQSLSFVDNHPNLAEVIVLALLGSDPAIKDSVHEVYGRLFAGLLDDLQAEGFIPNRSPLLASDLTQTLLSLIFLGGCPWLQMDYLSFVYPHKVAISALDALKERYAMDEFRITN